MNNTFELAKLLISKKSVTPDDAGCQELIASRLEKIGFHIEHLNFGEVDNLWATYGDSGPLFVFLGHTDVVPTGPIDEWDSDPFTATEKGPLMVGRGAADMKSSVAAFVTSIEDFLKDSPSLIGRIGVLLTSDEEGPAIDGVSKVVDYLEEKGEKITWCLVGEPTSDSRLGDVIKIGRRGSVSAKINVIGTQGHVAYPDKANNPIHGFSDPLAELSKLKWKDQTGEFQDSVLQISNINSGTGVTNVIPGNLVLDLNVRHSPSTSCASSRYAGCFDNRMVGPPVHTPDALSAQRQASAPLGAPSVLSSSLARPANHPRSQRCSAARLILHW